MNMSKPILTYFNGRGRAENIRLVLVEAGIEFVDNRVESHAELKASGKLPFGQLPVLEYNGTLFSQSIAICRFLARENGMYGTTSEECLRIDMIIDGVGDLEGTRYAAKTDEQKAEWAKTALPNWLGHFEKLLEHSKTGFFVGGKFSLADLVFFNICGNLPQGSFNQLPHVKAHYEAIGARPKIAAWVKSRPETRF